MLTKKIKPRGDCHVSGFLSWAENSHMEQREINPFLSLGRDKDNLVCLNDDFISRRHCRIQKNNEEGFVLQDMNSRNGTFLNGSRVFRAILRHKDRIQIGDREFVFSFTKSQNTSHMQSKNPYFREQLQNLPNMAASDMPVLITGPSGTGKELIARFIHQNSFRKRGPMISINCSALSESLIESEFFGHIKGSYTGALTHRKGAFVAARRGSLFLDEIGDLPLPLQPKLLRAIEYQEIKAVGSDQITKTDVRIIAATHHDLSIKVKKGQFRSDLYFRLHVLPVMLPALRNRMEDFEDLLDSFCKEQGICFSEQALMFLQKYHWPGNIRELKNSVARAKALFHKRVIEIADAQHLLGLSTPPEVFQSKKTSSPTCTHPTAPPEKPPHSPESEEAILRGMEKALILKYLIKNHGNQAKTASDLGIARSTLSDRIKAFRISVEEFRIQAPPSGAI